MKIIVAKNAGFCFGVRRAVDSVYENLEGEGTIYTLGPIIHNPQVVGELIKKGVIIEENVENINEGTVIIRSHGVSEEVMNCIKNKNLDYIDATCPYVKRIHDLVRKHYNEGYHIIIIGEKEHPEVIGINGWCNNSASIINSVEDIETLPDIKKACVVSQTTASRHKFSELLEKLNNKINEIKIFNTICYATSERQKEAEEIAKSADKVFVIGGKNSSNTHKLYTLCKKHCDETYAVETVSDILLHLHKLKPCDVIGIVAGASTPDWIIKEAVNKMHELNNEIEEKKLNNDESAVDSLPEADNTEVPDTDENVSAKDNSVVPEENNSNIPQESDNAEVKAESADGDEITSMEDFEKTMVSLRPGQVVKGTVLSVTDEEITVNVGYKSDGIVPLKDIMMEKDQVPSDVFKEGDEIEVTVIKVNDGEGNVLLSQKASAQKKIWKEIEEAYKNQTVVNAIGHEAVKGGIIAKIKGISAFVPASQLSTHYVEDLKTFVNEPLTLKVLELDKRRNRVVASQRVVLEEIQKEKEEKLWSTLEEGQRITGEVKRLTDFGAFVDIGGVDGLIHISDISWHHIKHPRDVFTEGDMIEVVVLSFNPEKKKISLGYKQTLPHPWDNVELKYPEGRIFEGKVVRMTDFGAFIELEPGVDGLVHISQISRERVNKVEDVLSLGQTVNVKVLSVKPDEKRISLSIKEAVEEEPVAAKEEEQENEGDTQYIKEDMTVVLGEFFPENMHEDNE